MAAVGLAVTRGTLVAEAMLTLSRRLIAVVAIMTAEARVALGNRGTVAIMALIRASVNRLMTRAVAWRALVSVALRRTSVASLGILAIARRALVCVAVLIMGTRCTVARMGGVGFRVAG